VIETVKLCATGVILRPYLRRRIGTPDEALIALGLGIHKEPTAQCAFENAV